ncbi:MAG: branched-chain amino acid ABC transporter permease [Methylobacterium sp.]|uniref:branched-chain amino acid ABC transporter permease n=1 Tax=Methylobacterium sp. TaxID=409 RepID=UPI002586CEBE|nr:branched-chain amino acid ABC transporter permease [Methylobacterium sp.]MBY0297374.1 branched-chain amino acid ABC transporter permease [Methylobacterium sp.]
MSGALTAPAARGGTGRGGRLLRQAARHRVGLTLAVLALFPFVAPYEALAVNILVLGLYALGFNLLFGYTGLLSFGHAAFLGAGAYGTGIAIVHGGLHPLPAIAAGVVLATLIAAVMGFLAIRTRGIYFAMTTLALSMCVYYAFYQMEPLTGGENGLRGINVPALNLGLVSLPLIDPLVKYYVILVFVGTAVWLFSRLLASPFGAVLEAIRENENRARACGYDVARTKLVAFVISGAVCGLAGALNAIHLSIVPIETMHYAMSGEAVMMALLGGMRTFFGPFVGAATFLVLQDGLATLTSHWQLFTGAIFIAFVLFLPSGIWGEVVARLKRAGS